MMMRFSPRSAGRGLVHFSQGEVPTYLPLLSIIFESPSPLDSRHIAILGSSIHEYQSSLTALPKPERSTDVVAQAERRCEGDIRPFKRLTRPGEAWETDCKENSPTLHKRTVVLYVSRKASIGSFLYYLNQPAPRCLSGSSKVIPHRPFP